MSGLDRTALPADPISVMRCAPGQRTPKDQIKLRARPPVFATLAGLVSGQTMLSKQQPRAPGQVSASILNLKRLSKSTAAAGTSSSGCSSSARRLRPASLRWRWY
jgi:hypothetical protein